jgi:hypothetical protein
MKLAEINEHILDKYRELMNSHGVTIEEILKSSACLTMKLFETMGVENIELDDKKLTVKDIINNGDSNNE